MASELRQAVVLIHGIGEQRPMASLRGFVDCVLWPFRNQLEGRPAFFSKPDTLDDTFELRRLIALRPRRTDFFEFYWAHLMPDAGWNRVASWFWLLMWRSPKNVPSRLRPAWLVSWTGFGLFILLLGRELHAFVTTGAISAGIELPALTGLVLAAITALIRSYIGDAAIYFGSSPKNVDARSKIRAQGKKLLARLNADPRYDRIVLVGHSLGSVIAYDSLALAWQDLLDEWRDAYRARCDAGEKPHNAVGALIKAEKHMAGAFDRSQWNVLADKVRAEIASMGYHWKVSDLITLGSPLTHGDFLMADSLAEFRQRLDQRELATTPPTKDNKGFTYYFGLTDKSGKHHRIRVPHQAAQFAATRWTNIYFTGLPFFGSDLIGGPVAPLFGAGVEDVPVRTTIWFGLFSHIRYWSRSTGRAKNSAPPAIDQALRLEVRE